MAQYKLLEVVTNNRINTNKCSDGELTASLKTSSVTKMCCTLVLKSQLTSRNFSYFIQFEKVLNRSIPAANKGQSPNTDNCKLLFCLLNKAEHDYTLSSHAVKGLMHFLQLAFLSYYPFPRTPPP